jgi:hypothetical protein
MRPAAASPPTFFRVSLHQLVRCGQTTALAERLSITAVVNL